MDPLTLALQAAEMAKALLDRIQEANPWWAKAEIDSFRATYGAAVQEVRK